MFVPHLLVMAVLAAPARAGQLTPDGGLAAGPFIGHVTPHAAMVWARGRTPGRYTLLVSAGNGAAERAIVATADPEHDLTLHWRVDGLEPRSTYAYRVSLDERDVAAGGELQFTTAPRDDADVAVSLAFGSCARIAGRTLGVWSSMAGQDPDAVVLLGDTPYIDSTALATQRERYRAFAAAPVVRNLLCHTPLYGTWDDHDFGRNDADGTLPGKEQARRAFLEYRAHPSYGDGERGVYTTFRSGPVQVFLLDTRFFAATGPSPVNPKKPTLLGPAQWNWLRDELKASTAPVKVLASGMVWNASVKKKKTDHWGTYRHERRALFRFLGKNHITGVVLVAGDIHRCRVIRHDTQALVGYDLIELISSPMHESVKESANVPHPGLIKDLGEPNAYMVLTVDATADPPSCAARFLNAKGEELYQFSLDEHLGRPDGAAPVDAPAED